MSILSACIWVGIGAVIAGLAAYLYKGSAAEKKDRDRFQYGGCDKRQPPYVVLISYG